MSFRLAHDLPSYALLEPSLPAEPAAFARDVAYLRLNQDQRAIAQQLLHDSIDKAQALWISRREALYDAQCKAMPGFTADPRNPDFNEHHLAYATELTELRDAFEADLKLLLTADQHDRYAALQAARKRLALARNGAIYPLQGIDIELAWSATNLSQALTEQTEPIIVAHAKSLAPLLQNKASILQSLDTHHDRHLTLKRAIFDPETSGEVDAFDDNWSRLVRDREDNQATAQSILALFLDSARELSTLNQTTLGQLRTVLTPEECAAFESALFIGVPSHQRELTEPIPDSMVYEDILLALEIGGDFPQARRQRWGIEDPSPGRAIGLAPEPLTTEQRLQLVDLRNQLAQDLRALLEDFPRARATIAANQGINDRFRTITTTSGTINLQRGWDQRTGIGPPPPPTPDRATINHAFEHLAISIVEIEPPYAQRLRQILTLRQRAALLL